MSARDCAGARTTACSQKSPLIVPATNILGIMDTGGAAAADLGFVENVVEGMFSDGVRKHRPAENDSEASPLQHPGGPAHRSPGRNRRSSGFGVSAPMSMLLRVVSSL